MGERVGEGGGASVSEFFKLKIQISIKKKILFFWGGGGGGVGVVRG